MELMEVFSPQARQSCWPPDPPCAAGPPACRRRVRSPQSAPEINMERFDWRKTPKNGKLNILKPSNLGFSVSSKGLHGSSNEHGAEALTNEKYRKQKNASKNAAMDTHTWRNFRQKHEQTPSLSHNCSNWGIFLILPWRPCVFSRNKLWINPIQNAAYLCISAIQEPVA